MKNLFAITTIACLLSACSNKEHEIVKELKPEITNFNPQSGIVGSKVTISGNNLGKVTEVKFNGTTASFNINGPAIDAQVPVNATSGSISVTSPGGTSTSANTFTVVPPSTIIKVLPDNNAVNGPVLIQGDFEEVTSVKFNGIEAPRDTFITGIANLTDLAIPLEANVKGIVTTRVPPGVVAGKVNLTITNKNGVSLNYDFSVLNAAPALPNTPSKITVKRKAKYIPVVFNRWTNEVNETRFIFIQSGGGAGSPVGGTETLTGSTSDFVVTHLPSATDKTIEVSTTHSDGSKEKLMGIYADPGVLPENDPAWQRIIFYDKNGRQILVHVQVKF